MDGEPIGKLNNEDSNTNELSQEIKHIMFILDKNLKLGLYITQSFFTFRYILTLVKKSFMALKF